MDKTALRTAAAKYGTPLYLFDLDAFTARAEKVRAAVLIGIRAVAQRLFEQRRIFEMILQLFFQGLHGVSS